MQNGLQFLPMQNGLQFLPMQNGLQLVIPIKPELL